MLDTANCLTMRFAPGPVTDLRAIAALLRLLLKMSAPVRRFAALMRAP